MLKTVWKSSFAHDVREAALGLLGVAVLIFGSLSLIIGVLLLAFGLASAAFTPMILGLIGIFIACVVAAVFKRLVEYHVANF